MFYIIYPIFFNDDYDRQLFFQLHQSGYVWNEALRLAHQKYQLMVFTDDLEVETLTFRQKVKVIRHKREDYNQHSALPCGYDSLLKRLSEKKTDFMTDEDTIALIDFRNPDVKIKQIQEILDEAQKNDGVSLGLFEPEDHPVQFNIYLETVDVELHMKKDPTFNNSELRSSKPFYIWLPRTMDKKKAGFLSMLSNGLGDSYEMITEEKAMRLAKKNNAIIYKYSANGLGTRIIGANKVWPKNGFIPFGGTLDESRFLLLNKNNTSENEIYIQPLPSDSYRLSVFEVIEGKTNSSPIQASWIYIPENVPSIQVHGISYVGPIAQIDNIQKDGALLIIERQVSEGNADRSFPLIMEGGGWKVANGTIRINTAKNCRIMGRQDFPEVLEFSGELLAVKSNRLRQLLHKSFINNAYKYLMPSRSSIGRAVKLGLPLDGLCNGYSKE